MHSDEERRLVPVGEIPPLIELDELVVVPRHENFVTATRQKLLPKLQAERQHDIFLDRPVFLSAGIVSAMARIDHDRRFIDRSVFVLHARGWFRQRRLHAHGAKPGD